MFRKLAPIAFVALALTTAGAAQAQTALTNGVSLSSAAPAGSYSTLDLGSQAGTGWVTQMPMSLNYAGVNVNLSFTGNTGVAASGAAWNPTPGQNFLAVYGTATLQFSSMQSFFGAKWSTPDENNILSFYNGSQLLASITGEQYRSIANVGALDLGSQASFNFSELGYDRVVISTGVEIGSITFSAPAPEAAPIPLNAASLGGLMSFLMMLAMRGKGGTQVMLRMAFASLMPRRRVTA